jgi:acyl carrier protein
MEEKLIKLIKNNLKAGNNVDEFNDNIDLIEDLYMDSIDLIKLFNDIESEFNIEFDYEMMTKRNLMLFGELKKYITECTK